MKSSSRRTAASASPSREISNAEPKGQMVLQQRHGLAQSARLDAEGTLDEPR